MDVFAYIRHGLHTADGINPIVQHFRLVKQVAGAGQEMIWKIFDAVRINDGKKASVFLFEKKVADKLHKPKRREMVSEIVRREVALLTRLKHSKILRVIHGLEECNDSLAFATEPVVASLANLLGNYDRLPVTSQLELKDYTFLETELKCGIFQITEAINHLHMVKKMVHLNICPQNIIVTRRGVWKLFGFGFAKASDPDSIQELFPVQAWQAKHSKMTQPDLDYIAPEIQLETAGLCTSACDVFSFGLVVCSLYNNGRSLLQAGYNTTNYSRQLQRIDELFAEISGKIPTQLAEHLPRMINKDYKYRPSMQYITMLKYFDDPTVECLKMLDSVVDFRDLTEKGEMMANMTHTLSLVPRKILYGSIFPTLCEQMEQPDMLHVVLPIFVSMIENSTPEDFKEIIQPEFKKLIAATPPAQVTIFLLEKLDVLLLKTSEEEIQTDILPLIFNSLVSNNIQCQEAAINVFSTIKKYLDDQTMRTLVLPRAKALFSKSSNVRTRLISLQCIDRLIDSLEKMMILEEVLPFLIEIQCTDVDIVMSIVSIYKHLLSDKKFGLTHNLLATKVMPTLIPLSVCPGLTICQFNKLMEILHDMLDQIERQRLCKMINELPDQDTMEQKRRTSLDMRRAELNNRIAYNACVNSGSSLNNNQCLLNVDFTKFRPPSTPELTTTKNASQESLEHTTYRRHASFQSLGMAEQAVFDLVRQRRMSQMGSGKVRQDTNPQIYVSQASMSGFTGMFTSKHRGSTASMGPVLIPDVGRRDSYGRLITRGYNPTRRSSFQGICETAMQFFGSK